MNKQFFLRLCFLGKCGDRGFQVDWSAWIQVRERRTVVGAFARAVCTVPRMVAEKGSLIYIVSLKAILEHQEGKEILFQKLQRMRQRHPVFVRVLRTI